MELDEVPSLKKLKSFLDDTSSIASSTNLSSLFFDEVDADKTVGTNIILSGASDEAKEPEASKIEGIPSSKLNNTTAPMDDVSFVTQSTAVSTSPAYLQTPSVALSVTLSGPLLSMTLI